MRFVTIDYAQPGMILAAELNDYQGRTMIGKGCELTASYIHKLKEYGYAGVYIDDEFSDGIQVESAISPELRRAGADSIRNADIDKCSFVAKAIVSEIMPQESVRLDMADLRSYDDYTFAHSVNVAVLCCVLGMGFGMKEVELEQLTLAGLLHDMGKLMIPTELVNKPDRLTKEEYEIMKTHSRKSYELLADRYEISAQVKHAVLFHHENEDGSGYPNGVTGDELSLMAKIVHVADVFDALTSKRSYKEAYPPSDAAEYLMGACGIMFDRNVVERFLQIVPLYPKGTEVYLSDGTSGIVIENSGSNNLRPVVKLFETGVELDLAARQNYNIIVAVRENDEKFRHSRSEEARKRMLENSAKKKIMAVDDMATNLQLLKEILEEKYELILIKSGANALNYLEKIGSVDLVLMDIDMPEMDGVEAARRIKEFTKGTVPILFVSALCDRKTVLACKELNAAGYIVRPYKSVYIKAEIERVLSGVGIY